MLGLQTMTIMITFGLKANSTQTLLFTNESMSEFMTNEGNTQKGR